MYQYILAATPLLALGKTLKLKRVEKGLTQEQLAKKLGVTPNTIANWENGRRTPKLKTLLELSKILDLSSDELALKKISRFAKNEGNNIDTKIIGVDGRVTKNPKLEKLDKKDLLKLIELKDEEIQNLKMLNNALEGRIKILEKYLSEFEEET